MKNTLLAAGVSAVVATLVLAGFLSTIKPMPSNPIRTIAGALSGPDISSPYLQWGGVSTWRGSTALATATTTPCAIQSPAATSTLVRTQVRITTATSTATIWTVAKSATPFATTTALQQDTTLASGIFGTMTHFASSTLGVGTTLALDMKDVIAPNTYIVWGVAGTVIADSTKLNGVCEAEFVTF